MSSSSAVRSDMLRQWMKSVVSVTIEGVASGEHPFGAGVFTEDGRQIAVAHNEVVTRCDPTAHAEILAIGKAAKKLRGPDLSGLWIVSTGEPCPMCLAAIGLAGIQRVAYGASAATIEAANFGTLGLKASDLASQLSPAIELTGGVLEYDCSALLINHRRKDQGDG
ncbi:pyrimidine-ribonucleotide metabolism [Rhodopirellula islandica]|uniref:Pyrimidine-ribonucleotide metabolism n=1 Tax=Rhodopirellula islandica TaxID=595434 RepID=A0A0J1BHH7_RHOIS|nr:nucleoside deaminase [Rhodopirellula islandica]KLU05992.1 pyrimidine-ribonucleotide metabolism [Rhodopirellula islandica]